MLLLLTTTTTTTTITTTTTTTTTKTTTTTTTIIIIIENEDTSVVVGLRLGAALCQAHQCPCRALVEVNSLHGLSCKLGLGKYLRLASINDIIYRTYCCADIPAVKE